VHVSSQIRRWLQRASVEATPPPDLQFRQREAHERLRVLRTRQIEFDRAITPLAQQAGELGNRRWGPLMHAGNNKSRLARQIERYADVYTSRVSNLRHVTPFGYLRLPGAPCRMTSTFEGLPRDCGPHIVVPACERPKAAVGGPPTAADERFLNCPDPYVDGTFDPPPFGEAEP
jgi:hypothetical protein